MRRAQSLWHLLGWAGWAGNPCLPGPGYPGVSVLSRAAILWPLGNTPPRSGHVETGQRGAHQPRSCDRWEHARLKLFPARTDSPGPRPMTGLSKRKAESHISVHPGGLRGVGLGDLSCSRGLGEGGVKIEPPVPRLAWTGGTLGFLSSYRRRHVPSLFPVASDQLSQFPPSPLLVGLFGVRRRTPHNVARPGL